jgi:uncharacterized protein (TIGR03083 family)
VPTSLSFDDHLAALESAGARLVALAEDAGMDAPVPTCPEWDVRALVAHQATVHRWATAHVRGDDPGAFLDDRQILSTVDDLPAYFREGHLALVAALRAAPPDLEAMTFLKDAPTPREFWARRQAHETTIHMVDALGATVGRWPTVAEAGLAPPLAVDGIDELLRGFFTRGASKLYDGEDYTMAVAPTDADRRWVVHVAPRLTVEPGNGEGADPAATLTGTAVGLYLALWNRGEEVEAAGRRDVLGRWRETQRVGWS